MYFHASFSRNYWIIFGTNGVGIFFVKSSKNGVILVFSRFVFTELLDHFRHKWSCFYLFSLLRGNSSRLQIAYLSFFFVKSSTIIDFWSSNQSVFKGNFVWTSISLHDRNNLIIFKLKQSSFCLYVSLLSRNFLSQIDLIISSFHSKTKQFSPLFSHNFHGKFLQHISVDLFTKLFDNFQTATLPHSSCSYLASAEKSDNFWVCSFVYILNDRSALRTNHQILEKITLTELPYKGQK